MRKIILLSAFLVLGVFSVYGQGLPSYVPTSGLLAWYSFSGNTNDNSGNGNNGTDSGAVLTTDRFGTPNSAYYFNGSAAITTSFLPPTGNAPRTISCWFKYDTLPDPCGDPAQCIVGYGGNTRACSEANENFSLEICYGPTIARVDGICIANAESGVADTVDNNWHFFAAEYDPSFGDFSNIKLYIDGTYKPTNTSVFGGITSVITGALTNLEIGRGHYNCARYFNGKIDDIGVWNRALSESELFVLYNTIPTASTDSFRAYVESSCVGLQFTIVTNNYSPGQHVVTYLSNGNVQDTTVQPFGMTGVCSFSETLSSSGMYTIKHVLYDGSVKVDSVTYTYNYLMCNSILVNYFNDANHNCVFDSSSESVISMPMVTEIDSNGVAIDTIPSAGGFYYMAYGNPGDVYTFKAISYPASMIFSCPAYGIVTDTLHASSFQVQTNYIGLVCDTAPVYDLSITAVIHATGTNDQSGDIYVQNIANCMPQNAIATLTFTPKFVPLDIQDGGIYNMIPPPSTIGTNDVTWELPSLSTPGTTPVHIWYAIYHSPSIGYLTIGDTVHTHYAITPTAGDIDTVNNSLTLVEVVEGGCDPNEMWVSPAGCLPYTTGSTKLQYTLMFENTGTDTAYNIYVMDTLPNNVDISTLQLTMASVKMNFSELTSSTGQHILKFDFPGIDLPDSSHHGECYGTVIFSINTLPGLVNGTEINNEAGVYFDYNAVVMTNSVQNIVGCTASSVATINNSAPLDIFPNPAKEQIELQTDPGVYNSFSITNDIGQLFVTQSINAPLIYIDIKTLPAGLYYITVTANNGAKVVKKFIKE